MKAKYNTKKEVLRIGNTARITEADKLGQEFYENIIKKSKSWSIEFNGLVKKNIKL